MIQKIKEIFIHNWPLKVGAFITTIVLFFIVHGDNYATITTSIPLRITVPKNMVQMEPLPDRAQITISGSRSELQDYNSTSIKGIVLNIEASDNNSFVSLPIDQIDVPSGLRLASIQPEFIRVNLQKRVNKKVRIEARLIGSVPSNFHVINVNVSPSVVEISGPQANVDAISLLFTEPIYLNTVRTSQTIHVAVRLDDPLVTFEDIPNVAVNIETQVVEKHTTFDDLPVTVLNAKNGTEIIPNKVSVELSGEEAALNSLNSDTIKAVVDLAQLDGKSLRKLTITPKILNLPNGVKVEAIRPKTIVANLRLNPEVFPLNTDKETN